MKSLKEKWLKLVRAKYYVPGKTPPWSGPAFSTYERLEEAAVYLEGLLSQDPITPEVKEKVLDKVDDCLREAWDFYEKVEDVLRSETGDGVEVEEALADWFFYHHGFLTGVCDRLGRDIQEEEGKKGAQSPEAKKRKGK